jgi:hypothetical protein
MASTVSVGRRDTTLPQYFALAMGIIYTLVGILGFIPGLSTHPGAHDYTVTVDAGYRLLLGLFPINVLHNIVHILIGLAGFAAYRSGSASRTYAQALAVVYLLLAVMGVIPGLNTVFGLIPIFNHDVWLHAGTGLLAAYFGFLHRDR